MYQVVMILMMFYLGIVIPNNLHSNNDTMDQSDDKSQESEDRIFSSSWSQHQVLHSSLDSYQPRVLAKNCFSISAFFSFLLITINTVLNVSTNNNNNNINDNNNNNNNNNNDNNLNVNNFMMSRKRRYPSSILSSIQSVNNLALSKLTQVVESEPDCMKIVKCDLVSMVVSANPPPTITSWAAGFTPEGCDDSLYCSLLP